MKKNKQTLDNAKGPYFTHNLPNGASAVITANGKIVSYRLGGFTWKCKSFYLTK